MAGTSWIKNVPLIGQLDTRLEGAPDDVLTVLLVIGAAILLLVALVAPPVVKAAVAAWIIAP